MKSERGSRNSYRGTFSDQCTQRVAIPTNDAPGDLSTSSATSSFNIAERVTLAPPLEASVGAPETELRILWCKRDSPALVFMLQSQAAGTTLLQNLYEPK